jgi:hypothetical protein
MANEISDESSAIMRQITRVGGRRGGSPGQNAIPGEILMAQSTQRRGIFRSILSAINPFETWMGPGVPMPVSAPAVTPDRSWDYDLLYNYSYQPDAAKSRESGVTMLQLKMLARQTHVALAKNRAKNKQKKKTWRFGLEKLPGEKIADAQKRATEDARVKEVADFFKMPDRENELPEWLGLNLENILTLGVTTIVPWRTKGGKPYRLEVYDPATVVPKLDASGRRPMGIDESTGLPAVAYQQYIKGMVFANFSDENLMWYGPNPVPGKVFPVGPTEMLMFYINIAIRKDIQRLGAYSDSNIPKGLLPMPPEWTPQQIKDWYRSFNAFLVNMPENVVKMVPIPSAGSGNPPVFPQLESLKDNWEEKWERLVFGFYDVPVSSLVKEMTHANANTNRNQADEEGEQYYEGVCKRLINRCIIKFFGDGYADVVARSEQEIETDLEKQSKIDEGRVKLGLSQINEVRERDGLETISELVGVNGYFNSKGDFMPFSAAIELAMNPPAPVAPFGGSNGTDSADDPNADTSNVVPIKKPDAATKLLKSKKKDESPSASLISTRSSVRY